MIRLLGILAGAALAVAALILLVGLPEFPDKPPQDVALTVENSDVGAVSSGAQLEQDVPPVVADDLDQVAPPTAPAPAEPDAPPTVPLPFGEDASPAAEDVQVGAASSSENPNHWYAFWSPFRSEIAANGFVSQLQRTTGLDYRVVKLKPGVYEVAFAYSDDADVENKLAQISAATGLDIPEG